MKKLLVMAAMVLSSVGAFAQYSAGDITIQPKVGLNVSSVTEDEAGYKAGFVGGVEGEYHVSPMVGISAGLLYSMQGASVKDAEGDPKIGDELCEYPYFGKCLCCTRPGTESWYSACIQCKQ